jgi:phosphoglycerate dehydrogenase-like enzyme
MAPKTLTIAVFNESLDWSLDESHVQRIRDVAGEQVAVRTVRSTEELNRALPETHYLVGFPVTVELIEAIEKGVRVCSAASIRGPFVAEHCMALALTLIRRIDQSVLAQAEHHWATKEIAPGVRTLRGSTVGIVAFEKIGDEIAKRAASFDAHVLVSTPTRAGNCPHAHSTVGMDGVRDVVAQSDVLIVAAPRLPGTGMLLGKGELGALKTSAIVISAGRGGLLDFQWLLRMLRREKIAGAAMDVFETEPLPPNSPVWTMPNVIVSPHVSTASPTFWSNATDVICENIKRLQRDEPLVDELDASLFLPPAKQRSRG